MLAHFTVEKHTELAELIKSFPSLFGDMPSQTHVIEHDIDDPKPIRQRFYRVSEKRKVIDGKVEYRLDNHIAVPSSSSWASPCLLVEKSDKSPRCCTNFRKVNAVTRPVPDTKKLLFFWVGSVITTVFAATSLAC